MNPAVRKISVLIGIGFVDMLGFAMIFPLLPFYALRLQAEEWVIGLMISTFAVAQLASAPLWGRVSDRFGRRPALMIGLTGSAIAFLVFGFAVSIWMLFLSRFIQGAGGGTTGVAQAYIGDAVEPENRAKALGWLSAATSAGVMIGPAIGSLAIKLGYAAPGLIAAGLCLLNLVFAWRWLPETSPSQQKDAPNGAPPPVRRSIRAFIWMVIATPTRTISRLIWVYGIGMLGFISMTAVLALYLEAEFGVTEQTIGYFFVYVGALSVVMRALLLGRLVDAFGEVRVMRVGAATLALGLFLIPLPTSVPMLALVIACIPIGTALLFPATTALVTHEAPAAERGQILGVQQTFGGVARVFAPMWATAVFQTVGHGIPFRIAALVVLMVLMLTMTVRRAELIGTAVGR